MENKSSSLTVIMPAYKEINNLRAAYESATRSVRAADIADYEVLIITNTMRDGRDDGTPGLADVIARADPHVRHIHNAAYVGLGFKYRQGVKAAQKDYVVMIPGDNETVGSSVTEILGHLGEAPLIITYTSNKHVRAWKRRMVSWGFTTLCNLLFGLRLRYFNGICIHPRRYLQAVPMASDNFAYMAEVLVYLVKSGVRYIEVPMRIRPITNTSAAFRLKSVWECLGTLGSLFWKIHFRRQRVTV